MRLPGRYWLVAICAVTASGGLALAKPVAAPTSQPATSEESTTIPSIGADAASKVASSQPAHHDKFTSRKVGAKLETNPPSYVKPLSQYSWMNAKDVDWLDFGIQHRTRFELRDDEFRPYPYRILHHDIELMRPVGLQEDNHAFLLRSRAYLGIHDILDPFRMGVEFEDARQFGSRFPDTDREADENDLIQGFGELYFKDALGCDEPLRLQAGRMTFDYIDRRLVARNRWRNTTNSFDGFRMQMGQASSDWELDVFAAQPVVRRPTHWDHGDEEVWFYGVVGMWRKWSDDITLEPYYFIYDQDGRHLNKADREIHTLGLHAFGPIRHTNFDYDTDVMFQFGEDGRLNDRAFSFDAELGYTFAVPWKPRLSALCNYASGDRNVDDHVNNRFDKLFEPTHPFNENDLFDLRNNISPGLRLQASPLAKLRLEGTYRAFWLASDTDAWPITGRRDRSGRSGNFVGQSLAVSAKYELSKRAEIEVGYAHFMPGSFASNTGRADDSDFFYVETTLKLD